MSEKNVHLESSKAAIGLSYAHWCMYKAGQEEPREDLEWLASAIKMGLEILYSRSLGPATFQTEVLMELQEMVHGVMTDFCFHMMGPEGLEKIIKKQSEDN